METETIAKHSMIECYVYHSMLVGEENSSVHFLISITYNGNLSDAYIYKLKLIITVYEGYLYSAVFLIFFSRA